MEVGDRVGLGMVGVVMMSVNGSWRCESWVVEAYRVCGMVDAWTTVNNGNNLDFSPDVSYLIVSSIRRSFEQLHSSEKLISST